MYFFFSFPSLFSFFFPVVALPKRFFFCCFFFFLFFLSICGSSIYLNDAEIVERLSVYTCIYINEERKSSFGGLSRSPSYCSSLSCLLAVFFFFAKSTVVKVTPKAHCTPFFVCVCRSLLHCVVGSDVG